MLRRVFVALLFLPLACRRETPATTSYPAAPVILISIDTLRADHLPAYGYRDVATPAIDALRRDGILYTNAISHCPMTLPSHVSILTGLLPYEHGVRNNLGYTFSGHDALPSTLKRAGYATGAAVSAYVLRGSTGLGPLFDFYDDDVGGATDVGIGEVARDGNATEAVAERWIDAHAAGPFFFFLHLYEPHWPYDVSYDHEIAKSDAIVGRLLARLKARGIYDRAIIVLLSDHGEGLGDHGEQEHGVFLYREVLHVPLVVKLPHSDRAGETIDAPAPLTDVAPMLAALTGGAAFHPHAGRIYSETMLPRIHFGWSELRSLLDAQHHFIQAPRAELYDVTRDPAERTNIAAADRRTFAEMRRELAPLGAFTAPASVDPEEARKLAALGYLGEVRSGGDLADPKDRIRDLEDLKAGRVEELVKRNPGFADAWLRLAAKQERAGRLEDAVHSYRAAIHATPVLAPNVALSLGAVLLRLGRLDEAAQHAQLALKTQPAAAHHLLGRIALARRDLPTAVREARLAMQDTLYRDSGTVLLAKAVGGAEGLRLLDSVQRPVRDLEVTRGEILASLDRADEAETAFRRELVAFPQNTDAYVRLAILHFAMGRDPEPDLRAMTAAVPGSAKLAQGVRTMLAAPPDRRTSPPPAPSSPPSPR